MPLARGHDDHVLGQGLRCVALFDVAPGADHTDQGQTGLHDPSVAREYQRRSVFTASSPDGGNAGQLLTLAVRLHTEPDPEFFISQGLDMMSSNAIDQIALVNVLRLLGHTDVSLVLTHGRGVRPDLGGRRLPHARSIVDEDDLAAWLAARLGGVPG